MERKTEKEVDEVWHQITQTQVIPGFICSKIRDIVYRCEMEGRKYKLITQQQKRYKHPRIVGIMTYRPVQKGPLTTSDCAVMKKKSLEENPELWRRAHNMLQTLRTKRRLRSAQERLKNHGRKHSRPANDEKDSNSAG